MEKTEEFIRSLHLFADQFEQMVKAYDDTFNRYIELEKTINDYSVFITKESNQIPWKVLKKSGEIKDLINNLRENSAYSVKIMEKYRALKLLNEDEKSNRYFQNIESCIEEEFSSFHITAQSKVLLVGSGSFPMTPLLIAKQTGAEVIGIDIDDEAITLGRRVVAKLGDQLNIQIENKFVEELECIHDITHIIFSSTVSRKYDILDQLYDLTNNEVLIAMRYGDDLKSLFNYPMKTVDDTKWHLIEQVLQPHNVFDVALYQKA